MVFTTTNLFKGIACPEGNNCKLTNCIYTHPVAPVTTAPKPATSSNEAHTTEPAPKRRRVTYESLADKPPSRAEKIKADLEAIKSGKGVPHGMSPSALPKTTSSETSRGQLPASLSKPVSPPPAGGLKPTPKQTNTMTAPTNMNSGSTEPNKAAPVKKESLNPRMLPNAPESHAKRTIFIQHLHKDMVRLNNELKSSTQPIQDFPPEKLKVIALSDQEVIKLALDEEEKAARDQPKVYANVIKNRISAYRKMKVEAFIDIVKASFSKDVAKPPAKKQGKTISTGLTPAEEVKVAQRLTVPDQSKLAAHGYVPVPPTEAEAQEAARAVASSMNYEECDRCSARFRVFPDRNEEGRLTSNGPCRHHPNKKVFPTRQKTDHYTGGNQPFYPCCMEQVGSQGCTTLEDHVFKASSPARLAAVLPFITTPPNDTPSKDRKGRTVGAVGFDCEMGYTAFGLELIRLTAVSWPENELLVDVLVRPLGTIIDLNSRFSGVWPEHFANAIPLADWQPPSANPRDTESTTPPLPIVDNPQKARELLCSFLKPTTPLIGHAIENDLNATRLCHPSIIDTMILFPHPRGLPFRYGLKMLAKKHLERDVQTGGERGHDSLEDAVATGDLVRVRVAREWRLMQSQGWKFEDGNLVGVDVREEQETSAADGVQTAPRGMKRPARRAGLDGVDEGDDDDGGDGREDEFLGGEGLSVDFLEKQVA
jgi:hypothetical protein